MKLQRWYYDKWDGVFDEDKDGDLVEYEDVEPILLLARLVLGLQAAAAATEHRRLQQHIEALIRERGEG